MDGSRRLSEEQEFLGEVGHVTDLYTKPMMGRCDVRSPRRFARRLSACRRCRNSEGVEIHGAKTEKCINQFECEIARCERRPRVSTWLEHIIAGEKRTETDHCRKSSTS